MKKKLKLYVWENVLTDYTSGVMFTLAPDVATARKAILAASKFSDRVKEDLKQRPIVVSKVEGFLVFGGS